MKTELVFKRPLLRSLFLWNFTRCGRGRGLLGNCGVAGGKRFYDKGEKQKIDKIRGICYTVYITEKEAE